MGKLGNVGKSLIEQQHDERNTKPLLRWALLLALILIMFGGALVPTETASSSRTYGYVNIKLVLFGIGIGFAFDPGDKIMRDLLGDNKLKLMNHWDWLWSYMVP
ncbi:unnamed protein product [Rotaria sp. Silwood1]|nr:unnamed protein product [Rotaria sp. Silwood1]CAF1659297.1 unnamed protein product [Rotaria sp. Silwood1]CAF3806716.1 unnamed protein product [Rotaria sp. Silwood1]CAF3810443.1 unnamed protein product [Rotaria sp. Silwood1]CAF3857590.1 unnamed protein product [Rotaria sp. Silwood1]